MTLSVIGIIISLAFLIILALRGFHIIFLAPAAVVIVSLMSDMDVLKTLTGPYMKGFVSYAMMFYLMFLTGSFFAKFMEDSGAARSIAQGILGILGPNSQYKALLAISFISIVLTYGGVNAFVCIFAVLPIARPIFKELNIPWHLFFASFVFGTGSITLSMLPGAPSITNIMAAKYLGTTAMAAPAIGLIGAAVLTAFNCWYMWDQLRRSRARDEGYAATAGIVAAEEAIPNKGVPNLWLSLVPLGVVIVLLNVMKLDVVIALTGGSVSCLVLFWKYFDNKLNTFNKGALNTVIPIVNTCADVGYGMSIAATAGFKIVSDWLLSIGGHPIVSLSIATNLMCGITGSSSGGLGIVMVTLVPKFVEMGMSPELIHRIAVMSSACFDGMPHNGALITMLALSGLTHANAYKHEWWGHIVGTVITLIIVIPIGLLIYK